MGIAMATPQVSRKSDSNSREQSNNEGDGYFSKTQLKSEFELLQTLSRLLVKFVKFWQIFLELPWDCVKVQEKKRKVVDFCSCPPKIREIGQFHVVVLQRGQRNVQKKNDAPA